MELQLDAGLSTIFGQLVIHRAGDAWRNGFQDVVEVVPVNLHELAVFQFRQGLLRFSREVGQNSHDQRQFFFLDGSADLNVIRDLYPGRPDTI